MIFEGAIIGDVRRTLADVLPEDLKSLRKNYVDPETGKVGLEFKELEAKVGIKAVTLRKYESGEIVPSVQVITKLSDFYDVDFMISAQRKHPLADKQVEPEGV